MWIWALSCADTSAPATAPAGAAPEASAPRAPEGHGILAPSVEAPANLGLVLEDAAKVMGALPLRVAEGTAIRVIESCEVLEAVPNPLDPLGGDCADGDDRREDGCGFFTVANLGASPPRPTDLDARLMRDPAAFDVRTWSNGGTCGWLAVDLTTRRVEGDAVWYTATAGSVSGQVVLRFEQGVLKNLFMDEVINRSRTNAEALRRAQTDAVAARLRLDPTTDDYRWLRGRDRERAYTALLEAAAASLEQKLAAVPPPIEVGPVQWEPAADGTRQLSVAVRNRSGRMIENVQIGVRMERADGTTIEEGKCARQNLAATLSFAGHFLPDDTIRLFSRPYDGPRLPESAKDAARTSVVPLSVTFADGTGWESWVTVREVASTCD